MKKLILTIITAIIAVAGCNVVFAEEYTQLESDVPENIMFLGDSIATGFGLDGYGDGLENCQSYANILYSEYSQELSQYDTHLMNEASDGLTSQGLLDKLNSGSLDEDLQNIDVIVVSIGGNDLLGELIDFIYVDLGLTIDSTWSDVEALDLSIPQLAASVISMSRNLDENITKFNSNISAISSYISNNSNAKLFIQTLYDPMDDLNKIYVLENLTSEKVKKLNQCINENCVDESGSSIYTVVDVFTAFEGRGTELTRIKSGDIHPNEEGHQIIAQVVDEAIHTFNYAIDVPKEATMASVTDSASTESEAVTTPSKLPVAIFMLLSVGAMFAVFLAFKKSTK